MGAEETMARVREALGDLDGIEVEFLEEVIGNSSPVESPLMDAIRDWIGEAEPGAEVVPIRAAGLHRLALRSATPSPTASPTASSRTST